MFVLNTPPAAALRNDAIMSSSYTGPATRGLHSSTYRLHVDAFCRIGGAFRGCIGGV